MQGQRDSSSHDYQACLHKLISTNWLLGKASLQEFYKRVFAVGLRVAPLFKQC